MGKLGRCCCVGDCLTPLECEAWNVSWDGYTPTISKTWQTIENTTASGNTSTVSVSGSCGFTAQGTEAWDGYFSYNWQYRLRIRKGHTAGSLTCATWPSGFTGPASKTLRAGSDTGISTFNDGSQCYAVFHVGIEVYISLIRTLHLTRTRTGYSASGFINLFGCNGTTPLVFSCSDLGTGFRDCIVSTSVLKFTSNPVPYTVLSDLNGTHTLYRNPESCSITGPTYRASLNVPTGSALNGLFVTNPCAPASCSGPFRLNPNPFLVWNPAYTAGTVLPSTMTVTLVDCKKLGDIGGEV